jgi:hypothetical protein
VRLRAASVNPADWYAMTGMPWVARPTMGLRKPKTNRPGLDLAGVVAAVGANVARFNPGDEVFGTGAGTLAECATAAEDALVAKPANLSFEQAAAVPVAALTALQGLRDKGRVQPGDHVLINGASGGVGTFAVQLAKTSPAPTGATTCCSTSPGAGRGRRASGSSSRGRPWSWSERPRAAGSWARSVTSPRSGWPRCGPARRRSSSPSRPPTTWPPCGSCSRPAR